MKKVFFLFIALLGSQVGFAQKYRCGNGQITFFSDGIIEDIAADNTSVGSLFNSTTGDLVIILSIKDFQFQKELMREHFNEKYLETEKVAKSTFLGKLNGFIADTPGPQNVTAVGILTIHGVTKDIEVPGIAEMVEGKILMKSKFNVRLSDFNIKIPAIVWKNIAEQVEVKLDLTYRLL